MKKNVIALMLSFVMTAGSIGTAPVLAAENGATEVETAAQAAESEEILEEHQPEEYPAVPIELEEEAAENYAQDELEEASGEETDGEYNDLTDQSVDNETDSLDQEDVQQDADAEGVSEGPAEKETLSPDSAVPEELRTEQTTENKMTPDQIQAFQDCVKIWKTDNRVTIVYDSTEDVQLEYSLYSGITDELLYTGDLEWDEESGLYYGSVDFDAVNEASGQTSGKSKTNIKGIPVRILLENNADQDDGGVERLEEIVSQDSGIVTIDTDTKTEGQIIVKWNSIDNDETDGYSVIVRGENGKAPLLIYDTACSADDTNDKYEILDVDHTDNDQISLNTDLTNVSEISVAAYQYVADTGVKCYGEAVAYERIEEEAEPESSENEIQNSDEGGFRKEGVCGDNVKWVLTGTNPDTDPDLTLTISGTGNMWDFSYDHTYGDLTRSDWTLYNSDIGKVVIEEGVTGIGTYAFYRFASLETITIPNTVTSIGEYAFSDCYKLKNIKIPDSVTAIGEYAFTYCAELESITIPDSVTRVGEGMFYRCYGLESIALPDVITAIEPYMFCECEKLKNITIPDSVTVIDSFAFAYCRSLINVTIPNSVTEISNGAFEECSSIAYISIPVSVAEIENYAFFGCDLLAEVVLPNSINSINKGAFGGCGLKSITIPDSVTSIEEGAFEGCTYLTSIQIPDSVKTIGKSAFMECLKLEHIIIPESVTSIGAGAFRLCQKLKSIVIPDGITAIELNTFHSCISLEDVTIPDSVLRIEKNAFHWCEKITGIRIPDSVTYIGEGAFYDCYGLESVTIPGSVTNIEKNAFYYCYNLKSVTIQSGLLSIGDTAFEDCESLTEITLPDSVTSIGSGAFSGCKSLTNAVLSSGMDTISYAAFHSCSNLTSVTIPDSMTSIAPLAFYCCSNLTSVTIPDSMTRIAWDAFCGCDNLTKAVIPYSVTSISKSAFYQDENDVPVKKLTIYGYYGSYAEQYANENGIPFNGINGMGWEDQGLYSPYKTIALQATSTGRYITCDVGSTDDKGKFSKMDNPDLNADATKIQWYEKFELVPCSDGSYALRSVVNRQYLSYTIAKTNLFAGYQLMCIADFVKTDEKLILSPGSSGVIKFQKDDHWLCVENGKLKVTDDINKAETFNQILLDDNQYADKELDILTSDEWFDLYGQGKGGYYDIQDDVGQNTPQNASTLRKLGYTLMNTSARIGKYDYIELGDNMHKMQCFVAYKETGEHCDVIISFQGTGGYGDDFPDALISTEGSGDPEDGKHKGYQGMATILISNETGIISEKDTDLSLSDLISEYKDRNVRFTILGHSMGGAIAQCYALHLAGKGIPKKEIRGRTFNSALAVSKDDTGFEDWYNLCVSTDSVCNGVITGSILSYGRHEIGKTIWLYDHEAELLEPYYTFDVISQPKHAMGKDECLYKILSSFRKDGKCDHVWDTGKITVAPTSGEEGERTYTCTKCGKTRTEKIPPFDLIDVGGVESKLCSGTAVTQNPVIKLGDKILEENTDYVISYSNNINIGTVTMTISGIGDYSGTVTKSFYILPGKTSRGDMFNLANNVKVTWKEIPGAKYYKVYREGVTDPKETRKDPVIVTTGLNGWDAQPGLTSGHAYRYKVVASLTGKGDPSGDSTISYLKLMYRLKTVVIRSAKNTSAGKVTLTYDKTTCGDSYVIQYSDNKDMDGATTKVIKGASNNSCIIGGLKKGKTYYFSIRVRKSVNGVLYYTTFGVAKKVVITK